MSDSQTMSNFVSKYKPNYQKWLDYISFKKLIVVNFQTLGPFVKTSFPCLYSIPFLTLAHPWWSSCLIPKLCPISWASTKAVPRPAEGYWAPEIFESAPWFFFVPNSVTRHEYRGSHMPPVCANPNVLKAPSLAHKSRPVIKTARSQYWRPNPVHSGQFCTGLSQKLYNAIRKLEYRFNQNKPSGA